MEFFRTGNTSRIRNGFFCGGTSLCQNRWEQWEHISYIIKKRRISAESRGSLRSHVVVGTRWEQVGTRRKIFDATSNTT